VEISDFYDNTILMRSVKKLPNIKHDIYKKEISKAFFNKTYPHSVIKTRTLRELNEFTTR